MVDIKERDRRRGRLGAASVAAVLVVSSAIGSSLASPQPATAQGAVSVVAANVAGATTPTLSADGRWIVFSGLDGDRRTVFRTDRDTGITTEISPLPSDVQTGDTIHPQLSADGCVVVAITEVAFDLFRDDDRRERWDVYRLVVPECGGLPNAWELVSMTRLGGSIDGVFPTSAPSVSGSGAIVAFVEQLDGAPEGVGTIRVVDVTVPPNEAGREQTVAGMPVEAPNRAYLYQGAREPALSENGRHLAFVSDTTASAALPGWAAGRVPGEEATSQVYVWDRFAADQRRAVQLVSAVNGNPSAHGAHSPAISEDGRVVAFVSPDPMLVPAEMPQCGATCPTQVYRLDRDTDRNGIFDEPPRRPPLTLVSAVDAGSVVIGVPEAGNASSWAPALNADGTQVAFVTDATNLLPSRRGGGGSSDDGDLLIAETALGALRRALDGSDASDVPGAHGNPTLSKTGQVIAFDTAAASALPTDTAGNETRAIASVAFTPQLSLAQIDFGTVLPSLDSTELYVQVQNAGPAAFEPSIVEVTTNFRVTGGTCAKGILVAAGSSCSVNLVFRPTVPRGYTGTLTVAGTGESAPSVSATVRGAAGEPVLSIDPGGVDLDPGIVGGQGGRVAFDINNISFVPTRISRIDLGGADPGDFRVVAESCTGGRALNSDASCAVEIEFWPTEDGYRSALVVATTDGGAYTAAVVGGFATYAPTFELDRDAVEAGGEIGIGLSGFPPDTPVRIGFDDGGRPFATVVTNSGGGLLEYVTIPNRARVGAHHLVASAGESATATHSLEVVTRPRATTPGLPGYGTG